MDTFCDIGQILIQAIWMVAFQNIVESVSFLTANTNWYSLEPRHFFELKIKDSKSVVIINIFSTVD